MEKDLTRGSITKNIAAFSVPVFLTLLFQSLFSTVDSMMTGNLLNAEALGSVASCGSITFAFTYIANGYAVGSIRCQKAQRGAGVGQYLPMQYDRHLLADHFVGNGVYGAYAQSIGNGGSLFVQCHPLPALVFSRYFCDYYSLRCE